MPFGGAKIYQEKVLTHDQIEVHWNTVVTEIQGQQAVTAVRTKNVQTGAEATLPVSGIFIFVGIEPITGWLGRNTVALDDAGFVITDEKMATSIPGIFAAGDVRAKFLRQITTAVGDGALAAFAAEKYLEEKT